MTFIIDKKNPEMSKVAEASLPAFSGAHNKEVSYEVFIQHFFRRFNKNKIIYYR